MRMLPMFSTIVHTSVHFLNHLYITFLGGEDEDTALAAATAAPEAAPEAVTGNDPRAIGTFGRNLGLQNLSNH